LYVSALKHRGKLMAGVFISVMIFSYPFYSVVQAYRGHGYDGFLDRFLQNTFSCCAVEPEGVVKKAAEMADAEGRMPRASVRREDGVAGLKTAGKVEEREVIVRV
jgi:hypothetical protein